MKPTLARVTIAVMKHYGPKQHGEERVYLTLRLCSIKKGSHGRNSRQKLKQKPWRILLTGLLSMLSHTSGLPALGLHCHLVRWALAHQLINKMFYRTYMSGCLLVYTSTVFMILKEARKDVNWS